MPNFLKFKALSISFAASISFIGSSVKETLIVSPIPLDKIIPKPTADFIGLIPASVITTFPVNDNPCLLF